MIHSLNLVSTFPYPPHSGRDVRVWSIYSHLSSRIHQTLLCRIFEPEDKLNLMHRGSENLHFENICIRRPGLFQKVIKGLSFLSKPYPLMAAGWYFYSMKRHLSDLLKVNTFDIINVETTWLGVYWPIIRKHKALKVLSLHNLEEELLWREAKTLPVGVKKCIFLHDALKMYFFETRMINCFDMLFVTSERERLKLLKRNPDLHIEVAPNGVDCDKIQKLPISNNREILFVGAMNYLPNVDGVMFFVKEILPLLRHKFTNITFRVVGKSPSREIRKLNSQPGITITGEVDNLEPYYRHCALCIVPLRSGGGTRLKVIEAMAYGRPVVSTSIGCEGIDVQHEKNILIADGPVEIFHAISRVLYQPNLVDFLVTNARSLVEEKYSWAKIADGMYEEYNRLITERHQKKND